MLTEPGSSNLFVALTLGSAREIFWEPFRIENERCKWGFKFDSSKMIVTHPNGSRLLVRGADDIRSLEKLRGGGFRRIFVDECGAQRPNYLKYLIEEILEPTLMDSDGELWLAGTPTIQAFGYFYDCTNGRIPGWSVFHWTAEDNPHVQWQKFVHDPETGLLARRGWTLDHPIFRREYLAEWVVESERLVFRFLRERNVVAQLPQLQRAHDVWRRVLTYDFGVMDAMAGAALTYPELYGQDVYVEHCWDRVGLAPSDAAELIMADIKRFDPDVIVGDVNGIGKAFAQEFNKHYPSIVIKPAKKEHKRSALEFTSDALYTASSAGRRGLFSLAGNESLHRQFSTLLWDDTREDIADGQDDNIAMAVVYGYRETPAYANAASPEPEDNRPRHVREDDDDYEPPEKGYQEVSDL